MINMPDLVSLDSGTIIGENWPCKLQNKNWFVQQRGNTYSRTAFRVPGTSSHLIDISRAQGSLDNSNTQKAFMETSRTVPVAGTDAII